MSIQSRIEGDLANENTASQSRIEQILNGEVVAPKSRIEQLLMAYNPEDPGDYHKIECTKEQYDNMTSYDDSTIYVVTYPDESVHFYLGAEEIAGNPSLIEKTITENGTYNASDDEADGYSSVTVDVASTAGYYKLPMGTLIANYYIDYRSPYQGQARYENGFTCTDYLEIDPAKKYKFIGSISWDNPNAPQGNTIWNAIYDENKTFISGFTLTEAVHTFPSNAKYIRISQQSFRMTDATSEIIYF